MTVATGGRFLNLVEMHVQGCVDPLQELSSR